MIRDYVTIGYFLGKGPHKQDYIRLITLKNFRKFSTEARFIYMHYPKEDNNKLLNYL